MIYGGNIMNILEKQCKVCPVGCKLTIYMSNEDYIVEGNRCPRGRDFAIKDMESPSRVITSKVKLHNSQMGHLPVKSDGIIPSNLISLAMDLIQVAEANAPIEKNQIIIEDILNTGVNIIASRKVNGLKKQAD